MPPASIQDILGVSPSSSKLKEFLSILNNGDAPDPEVKTYPEAIYFNYYSLGLSFLFVPQNGYKPKIGLKFDGQEEDNIVLDSIDVYNSQNQNLQSPNSSSRIAELAFSTFPVFPLVLNLAHVEDEDGKSFSRLTVLNIAADTTGKEFVGVLGEPDRKGGGAGPSSGSIGIWCEWSKNGIMIEFGGEESRGPRAWEQGKDAVWKVITVFRCKNA